MVGDYAHGHVNVGVSAVFLVGQLRDFLNQRGEYVGIVVRCLALQGHAQTFEAHAGVDDLCGQGNQRAVGQAVVLHEHEVPDFDYLGMVVVHEACAVDFGAFAVGTQVDVDFRAGAAWTGIAHFPEIIVLVAVDDVGSGQMLLPVTGGFVVTLEALGGRTFEYGGVETGGVEVKHVDEIFPGPVDGFFLEIVAERPVSEHLEHGVVVGIVSHLFEVVMLAADTQAFLRVGDAGVFRGLVAEDDVLELVHSSVCEHQGRVVFDYHGCRRNDVVALRLEKVFVRLTYFFGCQHIYE